MNYGRRARRRTDPVSPFARAILGERKGQGDQRIAAEGARRWCESKKSFTADEARRFGEEIGIDWDAAPFDVEQLRIGMNVELEHGLHDVLTNVSDDDPHVTAKIALAHLNEFPDYYTRLERMEEEAKRDWAGR